MNDYYQFTETAREVKIQAAYEKYLDSDFEVDEEPLDFDGWVEQQRDEWVDRHG